MRERWLTGGCVLACVLAGAALSLEALRAQPAAVTPEEAEALAVRTADERTRELAAALDRLDGRVDDLRATNRELERRLADALREREAAAPAAAGTPDASGSGAVADAGEEGTPPVDAAAREELWALRKTVMHGDPTPEELARFIELGRESGLADAIVAELEGRVKGAPRDVDARMDLADAYITKLMVVPGGPEQGVWGMKAEREWQTVLGIDEEHWDARRNLAYSWSMWPEFLGKTDDAVREYETLVEIQERHAQRDEHAEVYVELSRLHRRQGDDARAAEILAQGLRRHPGASVIEAARRGGEEVR